jgi:anaerobic magnesium-protoporphyrin IX monomethyl ester cyclase
MKDFKTLLIFPPFWEPTQPYLSLPALTAWLRHNHCQVEQWDLNLEFHDAVISAAYLGQLLLTRNPELVRASLPLEHVLREFLPAVDAAKETLRSEAYYDPTAFIAAKATLEKAYQLLSLAYAPSQCSKRGIILPYRESSSEQMVLATADESCNPFRAFYRQKVLSRLALFAPDLIGISIADTTQLVAGLTLARMVREQFPAIHITFGGALFSKFAGALQDKPSPAFDLFFDTMISGEGELPLLSLVQALAGDLALADVPALVWRDQSGIVHCNDKGTPVAMNDLPPPDFDGLPLARYWVPETILPLLGSKDCYWKDCAFCDHYVSYAPRYRLRKPALMAEDMAFLAKKYNVRLFSFGDETLSPNYARHLSASLLDKKQDLRWSILSRLQKGFDPETCQLIYKGGCRFIMYGLESAHPRVIELMAKGTDPVTASEVYRQTDAAGIYNYSFIFFGFPTETEAEAQATVNYVTENRSYMHSIGAGYFFLQKFAPIFRQYQKYGITMLNDQDLKDDWSISIRYDTLEGLSQQEAAVFHQGFMRHLRTIYGQPLWLVDNSRSTLFLYLIHHGKTWMQNYDYTGQVEVEITS